MTPVTIPQSVALPNAARWLSPSSQDGVAGLRARLVRRALADVGVLETQGANRSPYIDECLKLVGSDVGSSWCAAILTRWNRECGLDVPKAGAASCDVHMAHAIRTGRWKPAADVAKGRVLALPGDAVVYGVRGSGRVADDAHHIGMVARTDGPQPYSVEGNTASRQFSRDGVGCFFKELSLPNVLGFINPVPLEQDPGCRPPKAAGTQQTLALGDAPAAPLGAIAEGH